MIKSLRSNDMRCSFENVKPWKVSRQLWLTTCTTSHTCVLVACPDWLLLMVKFWQSWKNMHTASSLQQLCYGCLPVVLKSPSRCELNLFKLSVSFCLWESGLRVDISFQHSVNNSVQWHGIKHTQAKTWCAHSRDRHFWCASLQTKTKASRADQLWCNQQLQYGSITGECTFKYVCRWLHTCIHTYMQYREAGIVALFLINTSFPFSPGM